MHQAFLLLVYKSLQLEYLEFIVLKYYKYFQFLLSSVYSVDYYIMFEKD